GTNSLNECFYLSSVADVGVDGAGGNDVIAIFAVPGIILPLIKQVGAQHSRGTQNQDTHNLLVLRLPVIADIGVVVRKTELVGRIVVAVGEINQLDWLDAQSLVAVSDSGRNQDLPRLKTACENRVDGPESSRTDAKVVQKDLDHARNGNP